MNAAKRIAEIAKPVMISESLQPRSPASISAQVRDPIAPVMRIVPGISVAASPDSSRVSLTTAEVIRNAAIPIGTLIRKIHCQAKYSTMKPPTIGPNASPETDTADQMPSAFPRSSGGNAAEISESESGMMKAAPSPCAARAIISHSVFCTRAARADVPVKITTPNRKNFFRPNRSPRPPAVICRDAKTSVYAETIH
jgi:hypothetical protein